MDIFCSVPPQKIIIYKRGNKVFSPLRYENDLFIRGKELQ